MTGYILLYVALAAPTNLGTYVSQSACTNAIRAVYAARMGNAPQVQKIIDITMAYQREYVCVKNGE